MNNRNNALLNAKERELQDLIRTKDIIVVDEDDAMHESNQMWRGDFSHSQEVYDEELLCHRFVN